MAKIIVRLISLRGDNVQGVYNEKPRVYRILTK
jgi:hypothetical protein